MTVTGTDAPLVSADAMAPQDPTKKKGWGDYNADDEGTLYFLFLPFLPHIVNHHACYHLALHSSLCWPALVEIRAICGRFKAYLPMTCVRARAMQPCRIQGNHAYTNSEGLERFEEKH